VTDTKATVGLSIGDGGSVGRSPERMRGHPLARHRIVRDELLSPI
jgi:hypothetical protein